MIKADCSADMPGNTGILHSIHLKIYGVLHSMKLTNMTVLHTLVLL